MAAADRKWAIPAYVSAFICHCGLRA